MLVLFTGMFRSGSTWAYNIARVLLLARSPAVFGEYRDDIGAALAAVDRAVEHHLIKTHRPDAAGHALIRDRACRTVCTYRDPLACIASHVETFGATFDDMLDAAAEALAFLEVQASAGGVLFVDYRDVIDRPVDVVQAIARYLGQPVDAADAARIAAHFSKERVADFTSRFTDHAVGAVGTPQAWESITLFYSDHIRARPSPPEALFTPAQRARAVERLRGFVDARGGLSTEFVARLRAASA